MRSKSISPCQLDLFDSPKPIKLLRVEKGLVDLDKPYECQVGLWNDNEFVYVPLDKLSEAIDSSNQELTNLELIKICNTIYSPEL